MVSIKIAKEENAELVALVGRISYTESHGHFIASKEDLDAYNNKAFSIKGVREELSDSKNVFYLIYVDKFPAGYAKLVPNDKQESVQSGSTCRLERIYILSDFIPRKIGQPFLTYLEEQTKELNIDSMWLTVYIKNMRAIKFYEKNGYKTVGEMMYIVNGKEYKNHVMMKNLA